MIAPLLVMQEETMTIVNASLEKMEANQEIYVETKMEGCPVRVEGIQEKLEAKDVEANPKEDKA
jgi:hypothetical protein